MKHYTLVLFLSVASSVAHANNHCAAIFETRPQLQSANLLEQSALTGLKTIAAVREGSGKIETDKLNKGGTDWAPIEASLRDQVREPLRKLAELRDGWAGTVEAEREAAQASLKLAFRDSKEFGQLRDDELDQLVSELRASFQSTWHGNLVGDRPFLNSTHRLNKMRQKYGLVKSKEFDRLLTSLDVTAEHLVVYKAKHNQLKALASRAIFKNVRTMQELEMLRLQTASNLERSSPIPEEIVHAALAAGVEATLRENGKLDEAKGDVYEKAKAFQELFSSHPFFKGQRIPIELQLSIQGIDRASVIRMLSPIAKGASQYDSLKTDLKTINEAYDLLSFYRPVTSPVTSK